MPRGPRSVSLDLRGVKGVMVLKPPGAEGVVWGKEERESAAKRGYDRKWRKFRIQYLAENPFCAGCGEMATVVDHIHPKPTQERGEDVMFDLENLQPLCKRCHDIKTRSERGGYVTQKGR